MSVLDYVSNRDRLPEDYEEMVEDAARRALLVGARPPLRYVGAGMTATVLCDARNHAFKVARHPENATSRRGFSDEAEWLRVAGTVPEIRAHVARIYAFHAGKVIIERECVAGSRSHYSGRSTRSTSNVLWDLHRAIEKAMIPYGFTAPEFKEDSFAYSPGRGWVVVDAGFAHKVGARLVAETMRRLARGDWSGEYGDTPETAAFGIRMEGGRTISPERAQRISDRLERSNKR